MKKIHQRPLIVSMTVLVAGIAASLAGNLQAINLDDANPGIGAYVSALVWPLFLFGAIEVMLHTPWIRNWRDGLTKWAGLTSVAGVSLWVSYNHLVRVLDNYGYDTISSHVGPLAIDLAMAMATMALNRVGQARAVTADIPAESPAPLATQPISPEWTAQDQAMLDAWDRDMDQIEDIVPVSPAPALARSNEVKPESVPETAREMFAAWDATPAGDRPTAKDMHALVAGAHAVSARTARRWYTAAHATA